MNRKKFLHAASTLIVGSSLPLKPLAAKVPAEEEAYKTPPYLKHGDIIGITSPAGHITHERIVPAIKVLQSWGYEVKIGNTIGKQDFSFGGTDEERAADFQQMLDDPSVKAVLSARGGYGSIRIVDKLHWNKFKQKPKWVVGFSDITVLHNHIHQNCKVASIHSKMCNSFPMDWSKADPVQIQTINSIRDALSGERMNYTVVTNTQNKTGTAEGMLIGGNLKTLETLAGSDSDVDTSGKILFVEDTGEYLYSIDRMFWNLKRTGKLKKLKGLVIGGFDIKPDDEGEEFGRTLHEIVLSKVQEYNYPVCFDFPVGHQRANFALKCGVKHRLSVTTNNVSLNEV